MDYVRSDAYHAVALGGLEKDTRLSGVDWDVFARAPATAMRCTLAWISGKYGSVEHYMDDIGACCLLCGGCSKTAGGAVAQMIQGCWLSASKPCLISLPLHVHHRSVK